MKLKRVTVRDLGGIAPRSWAIFVISQQKIAILTPFYLHFALFETIGITKLLKFRSHLKKTNCQAPSVHPLTFAQV